VFLSSPGTSRSLGAVIAAQLVTRPGRGHVLSSGRVRRTVNPRDAGDAGSHSATASEPISPVVDDDPGRTSRKNRQVVGSFKPGTRLKGVSIR
jgi:hypothetical protein